MKLLCVMILSIVSATNLWADDAAKQREDYFKKTIVGTWETHTTVNRVDFHVVDTFLSNGQMDRKVKYRYQNGVIKFATVKISWNIKNAVLILKKESITPIGMYKIRGPEKYKIISMDKVTITLFILTDNYGRGKGGRVTIFHRVKSQSGKGDI